MSFDLKIRADASQAASTISSFTKKASRDVDNLSSKAQSSGNKMTAAFKSAASFLGPLGIAGAAALAVRSFKNLVTETVTYRDEIAKMSRATGASVEELSGLGFAAQRSGADIDSIGKAFGRLARNISEAQRGEGAARQAFSLINVEFENTDGTLRGLDDVLLSVADSFSVIDDETRKAAIAQELFGRSGLQLVPLLNEGAKGIEDLRAEAERLGKVFGADVALESEKAVDALLDFETATTSLGQNLVQNFVPTLTKVTNAITNFLVATKDEESVIGGAIKRGQEFGEFFASVHPLIFLAKGALESFNEEADKTPAIGEILGPANDSGLDKFRQFQKDQEVAFQKRVSDTVQANKFLITSEDALLAKRGESFKVGEQLVTVLGTQAMLTQEQLDAWPVIVSESAKLIPVQAEIAIKNEQIEDSIAKISDRMNSSAAFASSFSTNLLFASIQSKDLQKTLESIGFQLASKVFQAALFSALSPQASFTQAFFGGSFATGGSFTVPGSGGTDSTFVGLRATPGEQVTVTPQNQTTNNNSTVHVTVNVSGRMTQFEIENDLVPALQKAIVQNGVPFKSSSVR